MEELPQQVVEIEDIPLARGSFTEISSLREATLMLFPEREDKKYIHMCPVALTKCSFDLRLVVNKNVAKYVVLLTPTLRGSQFTPQEIHVTLHPHHHSVPMNKPTSIIVWNTRGANNDTFSRNFRELVFTHTPCTVALLETKIENHEHLRDEFHFDDMIEVSAQGRAGGIVLLWITSMVTVTRLRQSNQEMHAMIQVHSYPKSWLFIIIYDSTKVAKRKIPWDNLENICTTYKEP